MLLTVVVDVWSVVVNIIVAAVVRSAVKVVAVDRPEDSIHIWHDRITLVIRPYLYT